jgi:hypothetical protein
MHAERGGGGRNERSDVYHRGEAGIAAPLGSIRTIDDSTHFTGPRHLLGLRFMSRRGAMPLVPESHASELASYADSEHSADRAGEKCVVPEPLH